MIDPVKNMIQIGKASLLFRRLNKIWKDKHVKKFKYISIYTTFLYCYFCVGKNVGLRKVDENRQTVTCCKDRTLYFTFFYHFYIN